ncbi:hypothetical protein [Sutcliffiella halmapala]|uniref:hypothetical protein n=1 Tax=Sutcliffiella halmapala TaxID=79882 RepID=UPI000995CD6F|nr:hypothetical protein [Sutcliffiella halmapala]
MYKESKKEKVLRFIIIGFIGLFTLYLFSIQYSPNKENQHVEIPDTFKPLAVVIQEQDEKNEFPIITMVKEHEEKPLLATYKINLTNDYKFETIYAVELKSVPTAMEKDDHSSGVWLLMKGEWIHFNEELVMEQDVEKRANAGEEETFKLSIELTETEQYLLKLSNESGIVIQKAFIEEPISVLKLSSSDDLWLVLFQKDTVLLIP